jgi:hypothetical protein
MVVGFGLAMATLSGGFAKVMMARLLEFFMGKDTKVKQIHQWLLQVEVYLET